MEDKAVKDLLNSYETFKEKKITHRRFKHKDLSDIIENLKSNHKFSITEEGKSVEGRSIFLIKIGSGKTNVLLWSQMHGDEATATMALFDVFNFFRRTDDFNNLRESLLDNLTLYFIPMLNPDGAEVFSRRNALQVDLNRDALSMVSPESQLLKKLRDEIRPEFGFNLHDMDIRYGVGNTNQPATIAFLAPPVDFVDTITTEREKAIKVIVSLNNLLQTIIPGQVGKWNSEFEPRAFGENIQMAGTSTILIESGGYKADPEKQFLRKLNFILLMKAFMLISEKSYLKEEVAPYHKLPFNTKTFFDLIIRNATIKKSGKNFKVDIGINRYEIDFQGGFGYSGVIEEIGDMSVFHGYEEFEAGGMEITAGKIYSDAEVGVELSEEKANRLLAQGFTAIRKRADIGTKVSLRLLEQFEPYSPSISLDSVADFTLSDRFRTRFAVVNGFIHHL